MIHTLVIHTPLLKVFLHRGKTNPTISSHLLFQKITLFGKHVLKNADQRTTRIGLIVNTRYHGLLLTLTRTLSIKRTKSYFIRFNKSHFNKSKHLIDKRPVPRSHTRSAVFFNKIDQFIGRRITLSGPRQPIEFSRGSSS